MFISWPDNVHLPVQLHTLEVPHSSDGGCPGPVQHESNLSEVVRGSQHSNLRSVQWVSAVCYDYNYNWLCSPLDSPRPRDGIVWLMHFYNKIFDCKVTIKQWSPVNNDVEVIPWLTLLHHISSILERSCLQSISNSQSFPFVQILWETKHVCRHHSSGVTYPGWKLWREILRTSFFF